MGWCSGTSIFDTVMDAVIEHVPDEDSRRAIVKRVAKELWMNDWDCESDSRYYIEYIIPLMLELGYLDPEDI